MTNRLGCSCIEFDPFNVTVANGNVMHFHLACRNFTWTIQEMLYSVDVLLLSLENYDLILGAH